MTEQRQIILEELQRVTSHPSADELYEMVRRRLPKISLGTVYRNLELLAEQGRIVRLDPAGGARRFDGDVSDHCHVRCLACGAVADAGPSPEVPSGAVAALPPGFQITGSRFEFVGYCPACRPDQAEPAQTSDSRPRQGRSPSTRSQGGKTS